MLRFSVSVTLSKVLTAVVKLNLTQFFRTVKSLSSRNPVQKGFAMSHEPKTVM